MFFSPLSYLVKPLGWESQVSIGKTNNIIEWKVLPESVMMSYCPSLLIALVIFLPQPLSQCSQITDISSRNRPICAVSHQITSLSVHKC